MSIYRRKQKRSTPPQPKMDHIKFNGGLDTETPKWDAKSGTLRDSLNYEIGISGGYQDIQGYEAFDGLPKPSDASYSILDVTISGSIIVADTVTQQTSGATGVVLEVVTSETPNYLVLTKVTGTFNDSDLLEVSALVEGASISTARVEAAPSSLLQAQYKNLAADLYRADISSVGGGSSSGDVLGLVFLGSDWYAFRDNAGGSASDIWKSNASTGWTQVPLNNVIEFTAGANAAGEPAEGTILTQTGTTATILRVITESGEWDGAGDAAGRMIIDVVAAGPYSGAAATIAPSATLTLSGAEEAVTINPNGAYEFDVDEVGATGDKKIYGASGVDLGFEFDGAIYVPIRTGMTIDMPRRVKIHKNHLFFSFGASLQHSGTGFPYIWSLMFGAAELAIGDTITALQSESGNNIGATLGVYSRNTTNMLYGSSSANWELNKYRDELGALPRSVQQIASTVFQDDRGITSMKTAQEFGNFSHGTITENIKRHFILRKDLLVDSCIVREKNQYRVFYSDGTAYYITMEGDKVEGIMPVRLADAVNCIASYEDENGAEQIMFGSSDGFVYQMDKGTSFNGDAYEGFLDLQYTQSKYLRWLKKYLGGAIEAQGTGYGAFTIGYSLGYGAEETPQPAIVAKTLNFAPSLWDAFTWDAFVWDGLTLAPSTVKLDGSAENIAIIISRNSDYTNPVRFSGLLIRFQLRRMLRE